MICSIQIFLYDVEVVLEIGGCLAFPQNLDLDSDKAWIVPNFGNPDSPNSMELILVDKNSNKIQATIRKQLINKFKDNIIKGNCYKMCYFSVVPNHGS
ncbi:hypothetical protein Ahy_B10g104473 [Arachis hypogaea]|uniref:Replication protein A 70 kDa DNA-binding subunit B/D first OB fold domain-containing protein n=1 Tax=Arachis hypogaea TaxID=3818 RepID=A0A444X5L6_ARAHY|nr:hypothetical protein Ahy_B10g104473 [Arachis hypogaea]